MRLEYKFLVNNLDLEKIRSKLLPFVSEDSFSNGKVVPEYTVRSIYFDSSEFTFYHEKIDGIKNRKKLRIRSYNELEDNNLVFLEIKNKYENFIGKNRAPLKYHDLKNILFTKDIEAYTLTSNGYTNSIRDSEKFFHHMLRDKLKPIILIVYEREAYFSKFDKSLRITLDKNLRYFDNPCIHSLYKDDELKLAIPNHFVLEVKFTNGYPRWLRDIVQEFNLTRKSVSKYTICIDASEKIDPFKYKLGSSITNSQFIH